MVGVVPAPVLVMSPADKIARFSPLNVKLSPLRFNGPPVLLAIVPAQFGQLSERVLIGDPKPTGFRSMLPLRVTRHEFKLTVEPFILNVNVAPLLMMICCWVLTVGLACRFTTPVSVPPLNWNVCPVPLKIRLGCIPPPGLSVATRLIVWL